MQISKSDIRATLSHLRETIDTMPPAAALEAVARYESMYPAAYGTAADPSFINRHTLRALDALINGDKAVDQYLLFRQINRGLARRDKTYFGRPLRWQSQRLEHWHRQLKPLTSPLSAKGVTLGFPESNLTAAGETLSPYDLRQRILLLLQSDLWAFETSNEPAYKQILRRVISTGGAAGAAL